MPLAMLLQSQSSPDLQFSMEAIAAAMRSVGFTLLLLVIVLYVFGIGFTQLLRGPWMWIIWALWAMVKHGEPW